MVLLLADDLMWSSRIAATGHAHGLTVRTIQTAQRLLTLAAEARPRCVILDLALAPTTLAEFVLGVRLASAMPVRFIAFGSHVDTATLDAARAAGCDAVLPRSRMAAELEEMMADIAATC
jgi:DNA-binding NarL/FixJ family response regulator